ncbi:hypothetical protein Vadar_009388 [Vaccinium darrowii]|uniref:Uncharacterized protein n=1 Tax=Vaccinium darrowii TaxID=229202 RepID=A0ACB7YU60_9ERIC|nr:hypothetical protein Vadar_009388 [Vaccinium darrowii]
MSAIQSDGDGTSANLAGMSKNELYDVMCQMKTLIEQNQQQAREILVQNPQLTKTLFQAQIMLGMVQPPQANPTIQPTVAVPHKQPMQPIQQANIHATQALPGQNGSKDQTSSAPQISSLTRNQHQNSPANPIPPASSAPPFNLPTLSFTPQALQPVGQQPKGQHINNQAPPMSLPQSSQLPNISPLPQHSASYTPPLQPPMSIGSTLQQSLQTSGISNLPLQSPLPSQPRLPSMPAFAHQLHSQVEQNPGFQHHSGAPQMLHSQPMFHLGNKPPSGMGPSFQQGQPHLPNQQPSQSLYQVGDPHSGRELNSQVGSSMQPERGPVPMPGLSDNAMGRQLPGPPPLAPGQMGRGNQPPQPYPFTPEMEMALLQQILSMTQEQINRLPPEQRTQVLQLLQIMRPRE